MVKKLINHIQFLRAISVLLVFFYHIKLNNFEYGFIGVDIFFVISGYIITSRIYNGYNKNNRRTIKLLLEKFYKMNKINDINLNLKVYKLLFKIENQLLKKSI